MTIHDRRRTDPVATHAYTVPVVRELPGCLSGHAAPGPTSSGAGSPTPPTPRLVNAMLSPIASGDLVRNGSVPAERRPSQRQLVAWSLLRCPDDRDSRDPR